MFEYASFAIRNPSYVTKNARKQPEVRRAMLKYRKENPVCAATGATKNLHVHHKLPVSVAPQLAGVESNFITLESKAHLIVGHAGNYRNYVPNVDEVCRTIRIQRTQSA
jgi:5-methylcytosine-specific restriction endonuclease McrA